MAFSGLLALIDDMATLADDIAKMAAMATQKSAGVVIDDMAVTAGGMAGMAQDRETAFVLRVAKGSLKNKLVFLVPGALALDALLPAAMPVLLMGGGAFLAFEAVEKVLHAHAHRNTLVHAALLELGPAELIALEEARVAQAIQTDLVLSAEIVAIGLAAMEATHGFGARAVALTATAVGMTVGVYGAVLLLVKIDNFGAWIHNLGVQRRSPALAKLGGRVIQAAAPIFRVLGVIGTGAMLLVGGSLLTHGLHHVEAWARLHHGLLAALESAGGARLAQLGGLGVDVVVATLVGLAVTGIVATGLPGRLWSRVKSVK